MQNHTTLGSVRFTSPRFAAEFSGVGRTELFVSENMNQDWKDLYNHPKWQKKRLEFIERDGYKCCECGADGETLNVHHAYYITGRRPWQYPMFSLVTLCQACHKNAHYVESGRDSSEPFAGWEELLEKATNGNMKQVRNFSRE